MKKHFLFLIIVICSIPGIAQDIAEFSLRDSSGTYSPITPEQEVKLSAFSHVFIKLLSKGAQMNADIRLVRGTTAIIVKGILIKTNEYRAIADLCREWQNILRPGDKILVTISGKTSGVKFTVN